MRLLVAGVTGQLGAGLVEAGDPELVEFVPLVRPIATRAPDARIRLAYPERAELAHNAVEGDVTRSSWGLDLATIRRLAVEVDGVLNIAGETNWASGRRTLDAVNVLGAVNGYELTRELQRVSGARKLYCYASSIHAAGDATGHLAEAQFSPDRHRTNYELSKWLGETALLARAERDEGPALCVARIGGLLGNSDTGATRHRNSLYMLADRAEELPLNVLPVSRSGRVDMLPRDIAAQLLIDGLHALHAAPSAQPEIVHVCAGESAPLTEAVLTGLRSIDWARRRNRPRALRVPAPAVLAVSEQPARYHRISPKWHNLLIGLRYLSLDRIFERSRLAALIGAPLPSTSVEQIVRVAFELKAQQPPPAPGRFSIARFQG